MTHVSTHTIEATLRYPIGHSGSMDDKPVKADVVYNFRPLQDANAQLEVLDVIPLEERADEPFDTDVLMELADTWIYGDGYQMALDKAKRERNGE